MCKIYLTKYIFIISLLVPTLCKLQELISNNSTIIELKQCLNSMLQTEIFRQVKLVPLLLVLDGYKIIEDTFLPVLEEKTFSSYVLVDYKHLDIMKLNLKSTRYNYVAHVANSTDMKQHINYFKANQSHWHSYVRFFVISLTVVDVEGFIKECIAELKSEDINGFIITRNPHGETSFNCYMYRALQCYFEKCEWNKVTKLNFCSNGVLSHKKSVRIYENSPPEQVKVLVRTKPHNSIINGYEAHPKYNIERKILDLLAYTLKIKLIFVLWEHGTDGDVFENGTITGPLMMLHLKKADIVIGYFSWTFERSLRFYYVFPYMFKKFGWCYPHELETAFRMFINASVLCLIVVSIVVLCVFNSYRGFINGEKIDWWTTSLNTYAILLGVPVKFTNLHEKARPIFGVVVIFSFLLNTIVITGLVSTLTNVVLVEKYGTEAKLYNSSLKLMVPSVETKFLVESPVHDRLTNCDDYDDCFKNVSYGKDSALAVSYLSSSLINYKFNLGCMKPLLNLPVTMYMRRGFPYKDIFWKIIQGLIETGFVAKFRRDFYLFNIKEKPKQMSLNYENIKPLLKIMLLAYIGCFFVFVIEVVYNKYITNKSLKYSQCN